MTLADTLQQSLRRLVTHAPDKARDPASRVGIEDRGQLDISVVHFVRPSPFQTSPGIFAECEVMPITDVMMNYDWRQVGIHVTLPLRADGLDRSVRIASAVAQILLWVDAGYIHYSLSHAAVLKRHVPVPPVCVELGLLPCGGHAFEFRRVGCCDITAPLARSKQQPAETDTGTRDHGGDIGLPSQVQELHHRDTVQRWEYRSLVRRRLCCRRCVGCRFRVSRLLIRLRIID
mmetsp:Transcript_10926/g.30175  ORF Transcript_10926/g.30175 Transcript_10926/m.30175 type:complete len:232 (-) Transcript_10926:80-775(-)